MEQLLLLYNIFINQITQAPQLLPQKLLIQKDSLFGFYNYVRTYVIAYSCVAQMYADTIVFTIAK